MRALPAFYAFRRISDDGNRMARRIQIWPTHFLMREMRPNVLKKALISFGKGTKNQSNKKPVMSVPSRPTSHTPVLAYDETGSVLPPLPSTTTHTPTDNVVVTTSEESGSALQPDGVQPDVIESPKVSDSGSPLLAKVEINKQKKKAMLDWCQLQNIALLVRNGDVVCPAECGPRSNSELLISLAPNGFYVGRIRCQYDTVDLL